MLCAATGSVCLQEPVMHLYVCFSAEPGRCLSTKDYALPIHVLLRCTCSVCTNKRAYATHYVPTNKNFFCYYWTCLSTEHALKHFVTHPECTPKHF